MSNKKIVQNNSLNVNQFVDYTLDKALMAETVHIMGNFDYVNEKYTFPEGDTVFAWIKFVSINVQYQMIFEWYTPTGAYYGNYTSVSTSPGPALWAGWLISPPCMSGLWRVDYRLKNVATGVTTTVASKNFTTVCNCATLTAPIVGSITQPSCMDPTGSVFLSGLPSNWTLTRKPDGVTTNGTTASITVSGIPIGTYSYTVKNNVTACTSPSSVNIVINNPPQGATTPSVSATQTTTCGTQSTTLSIASGALNSATAWKWYSGSCGTTLVGTGASIPVSPTTTTTYYVRGEGGTCPNGSCGQITITVNPPATTPSVSATPTSLCSGQSTILRITNGSLNSATAWKWYSTDCGTGSEGSGQSLQIAPTTTTTYYVRGEGGGCIGSCGQVTVTVNPVPTTPSVSATPTTLCGGQSTVLRVTSGALNGATAWRWYSSDCGIGSEGSGQGLQVTPSGTTTYYVRGEGGSCVGSCGQVTVTVETSPSTPTINGLAAAYCQNNVPIALSGVPSGGTFTIDGQSVTNLTPSVWSAGSHSLVYTVRSSGGACTASKTQTFNIEAPPPTPTINNLQTTYCQNAASVTLSGTPTGGIFTINGTPITQFNPSVGGAGTRAVTYKITSTSGICAAERIQTVQVNPTYSITENKSFCKGDSFRLPNGSWVKTAGTYTSNLKTVGTNCDSIVITNLTENPLPTLSITGPTQNCPNGVLTLATSPATFSTYKWSTGETTASIQKTPNTPTTYSVSVTDVNGCKANASTNITIGDTVRLRLDTTICKGLIYTFPDNTTATQTGTYTYRYQTPSGCAAVLTTVLKVDTSLNCGLVAHYKLNGNAADSSGFGNHGTPVGGVTWGKDRFGNCNSAGSFDGVDDKIDLSYTFGPYKEITVSAWVKINAFVSNNFQAIVSSNGLQSIHFQLHDIPNTSTAGTGFYTEGGANIGFPAFAIVPLNQWRHVLMIASSGNSRLYENGVQIASSTQLFNYITSTNLLKIGNGYQNSRFLNGSLDDIRIYNRALSTTEITQLYTTQEPVVRPPSVNITPAAPEICKGDTLTLTANVTDNNLKFQWSRNGQALTKDTFPTLRIGQAGNYTVRVYRANGCDSVVSLFVKPKILVDNGLVAYYPFDGDALDYSGNGNHGRIIGAGSFTSDHSNNINKAMGFIGSATQYIEVDSSLSLQNVRNISLSGWLYYEALGAYSVRMVSFGGQYLPIEDYNAYELAYDENLSKLIFKFSNLAFFSNPVIINKNQWYHIAATASNDTMKIYLNGTLVGQTSYSFTPLNFTPKMNIGRKSNQLYDFFKGSLDDIRIYNRALTAAEIQLLYKPATYNLARCEGDTLQLTTPSVSGVSYVWKKATTLITPPKLNITTADNGLYNLDISYKSCNLSMPSDTVQVNSIKAKPSVTLADTLICKGATANLQVPTGFSKYQWSVGTSTTAANSISPLSTQAVIVTVTDSYGCSNKDTGVVTVKALPNAKAATPTPSVCAGQKIVLAASPNNNGLSYQWFKNNVAIVGSIKDTLQVGQAGSYQVRVTDAGCDSLSVPLSVVLNALPVTAVTSTPTPSVCAGQSIKLTATGGTNYKWSDGNLTDNTTVVPTATGFYFVTVSNTNGCEKKDSIQITVNPLPSLATPSVSNIKCYGGNDGSVSLSASGGTGAITFSISPVTGTLSPSGTFSGLIAQTYTFTATDTKGCTNTKTATVTQPTAAISFSTPSVSNVKCNGGNDGKISLSANGGTGTILYSFTPNPTGSSQSPSGTFNNLTAQTYTFIATDNNNCTMTKTVTVTEPAALTFSTPSVSNIKCKGGSDGKVILTTNGGTGTVNFTINPSVGTQPTAGTFQGLTPQTYIFTAKDNNNCTVSQTIAVTEPATVISLSSLEATNVLCNGGNNGKIVATGIGGTGNIIYALNPTATQTSNGSFINLTAQAYTLTATDANGCTTSKTTTLTQPTPLVILTVPTDASACIPASGSATVTPSNGTAPYSYLWNNGLKTKTVGNLVVGTYTVTVTDSVGCTKSQSVVIKSFADSLAKPTLFVPSIGVDSILFSWAAVPNAVRYEVKINDGNWLAANGNLKHIVTDLKQSEAVSFSVRGVSNLANCGSRITVFQGTTNVETCLTQLVDKIPNGFTPGGNGTNDIFNPQKYLRLADCSKNVEATELHIMNRWGETIYKAAPYTEWDGKSMAQQQIVPTGVYYYVLVLNIGGSRKSVKGVVHVFGD